MADEAKSSGVTGARDLGVGVAALALSIAAILTIPSQVSDDAFRSFGNIRSPAFFPIIASGLLAVLSAALVLRSLRRHKGHGAQSGTSLPKPRVWAVGSILLLAGLGIDLLGFLPVAFMLIVGLSLAFGERRYRAIFVLAIVTPAAIHLLFGSVLNVLLPRGSLF